MPVSKHLAFLRDVVRNHPVIVASTAATAGVLLGGFVAVQLLAPPHKAQADGATPQQLAAQVKPAAKLPPKPVAETTGSASADSVAPADCDQQTWPNLSRICMEELRRRNPAPRVVSTDKLDKPTVTAIESQPATPAPQPVAPTPVTPAVAAIAPPAAAAVVPAAAADVFKAEEAKPENKFETAAKADAKQKPAAKKSKRKGKPAVKPELKDDDDNSTVASRDSDDEASADRGADRRAERRPGRSGRIVERWTEREYDVDSGDGGRRRVTVIRRNRGGPFENLFGMGRDRDDED
jgi:hypothetical protein